ncbi:hypothetical protein [Clostridium celatum]|uniref:Uncharacterized protein n=1 Tax=Clostridium celatum DSM 1785 TaxID=545697 RepID=L1Q4C0_9CLOT|nr:hypothetical protein [Clostridium celatum]EKY22751.1 hypothetical protein HMPREF0216_03115 [Clostridium celatum DSM 1785]MCE9653932.1 hypothetical protein [Clostridium celatum]MDU2264926.1 hypothetical protein [Clostridium celatum]MDU6294396.1 hypothetical protein [Clostridium celatum]MDY3358795.1 hypothetical protein [Clostridium celatum]
MTIFKKYIIPMVLLILVAIGAIKINIINTKSLSPLGNSDDNFNLVSEEFGEDFQEFIMDKSAIKIYTGEENDNLAMVKVFNKEINLTMDNIFLKKLKPVFNYIEKTVSNIKDKFNEKRKNNNDNSNSVDSYDLDNTVDDFIENYQGN